MTSYDGKIDTKNELQRLCNIKVVLRRHRTYVYGLEKAKLYEMMVQQEP